MNRELGILALFCLSAAIAEVVYLDDITGDHDKRNLRLGLPETMHFRLRRAADEVTLTLRENKHLNHNAPIYQSVEDDNGNTRIERNTNIRPHHRVRYYQGLEHDAYIRAECMKREAGPCVRLLTGNLFVNGKEHTLEPAINELNTRELDSYPGTPHQLNLLELPEAFLAAARLAKEKRGDKTRQLYDSVEAADSENNNYETSDNERLVRDKRAAPVRHGVEMVIVLDHTVYNYFAQLYTGDEFIIQKMREYYSQMMNGVDIRFASIKDPSISIYFAISGFYVSTTKARSKWMDYDQHPTNGSAALEYMIKWRTYAGLPNHDLVVLITRSNIKNSHNQIEAMGIAYVEGVCTDWRTLIIEDQGLYYGAFILAHEAAHSLGAEHDGFKEQCDPDAGLIMAPWGDGFSTSINLWRFSSCSVNKMKALFARLKTNDCTLNQAVIYDEEENYHILHELPGEFYSLNEQCQMVNGTGASYCGTNIDEADICQNFYCKAPGGSCARFGAADGTPCGYYNICFESTCQKPDVCRYKPMGSIDIAKNYVAATQSSEYQLLIRPASLALDGSMSTISVTGRELYPWWRVQFDSEKSVFSVKIWNRIDCCSHQLINLQTRVDGILCGLVPGPLPLKSCFEVTCWHGPIPGRSLEIQMMRLNEPLNIAEVEVFAGCYAPEDTAHYAYRKPVKPYYRSGESISYECDICSQHISGDLTRTCTEGGCWSNTHPVCQDQALYIPQTPVRYKKVAQTSNYSASHPASLAIDMSYSTVSITDTEDDPSWQIDFCTYTGVYVVSLTSRSDCCAEDFSNITVTVDDAECGSYEGPGRLGGTVYIHCGELLTGRSMTITRKKGQSVLALADVRLYGKICQRQKSNTNIAKIAFGFSATQSSVSGNNYASYAFDGKFDKYSSTDYEHSPWWQFTFCTIVTIGKVKIWNVFAEHSIFLAVVVDGNTFGFYSGPLFERGVITITATPMTGESLRISRPSESNTQLVLGEVQIFDA